MDSYELLNTDCMDYMSKQPDKSFDIAIVDPPYFSGPEKREYYGTEISRIGVNRRSYNVHDSWSVPGNDFFEELIRVSKHQIIFGINYYDIKNLGPGRIVWDKCNGSSTFSDCEIAYCSFHDSVRLFSYMWNGMMQGVSATNGRVVQGDKSLNEIRIHPTQKPVILYQWLFDKYVAAGSRVLDTHLGSGSSAIAARLSGLSFVGCELSSIRFQEMIARYNKAFEMPILDPASLQNRGYEQIPLVPLSSEAA